MVGAIVAPPGLLTVVNQYWSLEISVDSIAVTGGLSFLLGAIVGLLRKQTRLFIKAISLQQEIIDDHTEMIAQQSKTISRIVDHLESKP